MSSLVERLRVRTDRRPIYSLFDDSDDEFDKKSEPRQENFERIFRPDAKDESCQACGGEGDLLYCESCTYAYHPKCLLPPLKAPLPSSWRCPECVSPLNDIDKILDCEMRPTVADDSDASNMGSKHVFVKQYLVKWKGLSYLHCIWVPEKEFLKAYKLHPRLKTKVNNFHRQMSSMTNSEEDYVAIRSEWTTVDRILACRGEGEEKEYLVKWKELPYDECYWEFESDISSFQQEIERYHRVQFRDDKASSSKQNSVPKETTELKLKPRELFQQYERSPEFLSGGSLHPYQLEGLNFLRFSWSKQTHVILADEMGLGKTIQSIAFLASLFEEDISPHLVVAPLSTLRNWEREFATWAPQMNVVMYVGSAQARAVIREYEFFFPKNSNKIKKKKSGQTVGESKKDRTKFDVLLTSYEMINMDSASLKPIKWECMIVDEGHRLKNKDSKLFSSLKQYASRHRVLLTGTPLQNNLDELFMLMHFLDAGKFGSLEEFQQEFEDISQEEQISRLHKMLAPHLLRRVKKDVMKELPPKKELILRVELSSKQKEYYKAILTRNFQILARKGGAQISLINVVMELRKLCCHPFMLEGVEPEDTNEFTKQLLESSGKLQLLDKMMVKLKDQGHRVLIYSQFQHMLDLLEDYCTYKKWHYERIDGKVPGAERQIRIDRFNAKNSSRFCFLLSTRAGGLGINLATADTVIIYDSDWNPHADLQAMARAHRLGQTNKVMIFRLILRGTIEERMMQMTKKKMVLEHLVVGRLKAQNINQEELDDIIRYGSKELFADENDEAGKLRQIHYDDAAIDRLLNRDQVVDEDAAMDDEEEDSFLKAFKVANFEYIEEAEATPEEDIPTPPLENKATVLNSERATYWEELLRDRYEMHKVEEFNGMGKGKRSRKQMVSVEDDDLAGLEEVTSDGEDDNYEADLSDGETALPGAPVVRRPYRKRSRVDSSIPLPLMEGEGKSFRVLGFNQSQRAAFVKVLMRFGVGDYDWAEFTPRLKQKTYEEIKDYGFLFLSHIAEDITESPTFRDGVPKEGLRIPDVLLRIAVLLLIRDKVKAFSEETTSPLFAKDIVSWFPGLKGGRVCSEPTDTRVRRAFLRVAAGQLGRRLESMVLPLELLQQFKISDFPNPQEYEVWQRRNLKLLEAGLVLHPCLPLDEIDTRPKQLQQIIRGALVKPMETTKHSESMLELRNLSTSLACRSFDGSSPEICHWADGTPLNLRLYQILLEACFDVNDKISVIEEVDEVLEIIKKTWVVLGIDQMFHNICFSWVLFHRYVATSQVQKELLFASDNLLSDVAKDSKTVKHPTCSQTLSSLLGLIVGWAEKRLLVYHDSFYRDNIDSMQSLLSLSLSATEILVEHSSGNYHKRSKEVDVAFSRVDSYIRASMLHTFSQGKERLISSRKSSKQQHNPLPILSILAQNVSDLAFNEKEIYSAVLKRWHPLATGVAVATLHACYGNELKKFVSGISELTPDAVQVLIAADKLEKDLVQMAVVDAVDSEDGGKSLMTEMIPYEAEAVIANLVKSWISTRLDRLKEWVTRNLQQEIWNPRANKERVAPSGVEVLRSIDETFEAFFLLPIPMHPDLLPELMNGLDRCLQNYILKAISGCGSRSAFVPTMPALTRCSTGSKFRVFRKKERSPMVPYRKSQSGTTNGDDSFSIPQLCVRINTLHSIRKELDVLEKRTISQLRDNTRVHDDNIVDGLGKCFELSVASCLEGIQQLSEAISYKIIFHELRHIFWDYLYVADVSSSRIEPFLQELENNLEIISATVHDRVRTRAITNVMKASFDGFLLILLAGGPCRAFSLADAAIIDEDLKFLMDLFWSDGDGLPTDLIDKYSATLKGILPLFHTDTAILIEQLEHATEDNFGTSAKSRLPLPPTSGNWSPTELSTIMRVLCYRNDKIASKFLKKKYNLPKKL